MTSTAGADEQKKESLVVTGKRKYSKRSYFIEDQR